MPKLADYSDEELDAMIAQKQGGLSSMSDEELDARIAALSPPADTPAVRPSSVLPDVVAEGVSALNRGVASIPDFFIDAGNAAIGLAEGATGADLPSIPRVQDTLEDVSGGAFGQRNFMEPGLARTIVQEGGEVAGGFLPSAVAAAPQAVSQIGRVSNRAVNKAIQESAPTIDKIKETARGLYREVDDLGIQVNQETVGKLYKTVSDTLKKQGHNVRVTPKVQGVIDELAELSTKQATISEIDTARKIARGAAISPDPSEQRLGAIAVEKIDDFLTNLPEEQLIGRGSERVAPLLSEARGLWSRAKKGEIIEDMFRRADLTKSGFENGLRNEALRILRNKKLSTGFSPDEVDALKKVAKGGAGENAARLIGKFGLEQDQAVRALLPAAGAVVGGGIGGGVGAVAIPAIGTISQKVATTLTTNNAKLASAITRAGKDANKIARAYISSVPKAQRSADELAMLLLNEGVPKSSIDNLATSANTLLSDAAFLVGFVTNVSENQLPEEQSDSEG